jgi:hypothetical protein
MAGRRQGRGAHPLSRRPPAQPPAAQQVHRLHAGGAETFGLDGLLPDTVSSMEQQARRAYGNIARKTDDPEK